MNLDQASRRLLELDNQIATLDDERKYLREVVLEELRERGDRYYSAESGFELVAQKRKGRVHEESLRVVLRDHYGEERGTELWAKLSVPRLDTDLLASAIKSGMVKQKDVDQCREAESTSLIHRRPSKAWTA